jgi:hypothetical protein
MKLQDLVDFIKRYTTPCASAAVVVLSLIIVYFRMDVNTELEGKYQTVSAEGATVMNNIVNGSGLQEHVDTIQRQSTELESKLVRPAELAKNLQYFYRLEGETGGKLGELRQVPLTNIPSGDRSFQPVEYSLVVTADFPVLIDYLRRLEKGASFFRMKNFSLQHSRESTRRMLVIAMNIELLGTK